jgi:hypothetical protein
MGDSAQAGQGAGWHPWQPIIGFFAGHKIRCSWCFYLVLVCVLRIYFTPEPSDYNPILAHTGSDIIAIAFY